MKPLPFKMRTETPMEHYRAESFWTKEPESLAWIRSFSPDDIFFDVGANVGIYSLYAASLYPKMRIWAFEPMIENYGALLENYRMNGFLNISAFGWAVGRKGGVVRFESEGKVAGESGGQVGKSGREVMMTSIDEVMQLVNGKANIKIDIDGQELNVILGMRQSFHRINSVLVEVSSKSKADVIGIMTAVGFTMDNDLNRMSPHSRERREREGIDAENIILTR